MPDYILSVSVEPSKGAEYLGKDVLINANRKSFTLAVK